MFFFGDPRKKAFHRWERAKVIAPGAERLPGVVDNQLAGQFVSHQLDREEGHQSMETCLIVIIVFVGMCGVCIWSLWTGVFLEILVAIFDGIMNWVINF